MSSRHILLLTLLGPLACIAAATFPQGAAAAGTQGPLPTAPVEARIPARWTMPTNRTATIDFAQSAQADAWLHHVVLGDPSFDSFIRRPGNPVVRGKPPFEWPVNGFLFEDPRGGDWYSYVGHYLGGYRVGPGLPATHCRVYRSKDRGRTWEEQGPIFGDAAFRFEGDRQPATVAPDVSVVYAGGRYHMAYDWCTDNTTWDNASHPHDGADNGRPMPGRSGRKGRSTVPRGRSSAPVKCRPASRWPASTRGSTPQA